MLWNAARTSDAWAIRHRITYLPLGGAPPRRRRVWVEFSSILPGAKPETIETFEANDMSADLINLTGNAFRVTGNGEISVSLASDASHTNF